MSGNKYKKIYTGQLGFDVGGFTAELGVYLSK